LLLIVAVFIQVSRASECSSSSSDSPKSDDSCGASSSKDSWRQNSKKVSWRDFDWKAYIERDWNEAEDAEDPTKRFGIDLRKSIEIGAHRKVPDFR
jgi:hypothetical protein